MGSSPSTPNPPPPPPPPPKPAPSYPGAKICGSSTEHGGPSIASTFTEFVTGPSQDSLPADFQQALKLSAQGQTTTEYDSVVGSAEQGCGYCSRADYADTTYCACVNAKVTNPECIFATCANQETAYKTVAMQEVIKDAADKCPKVITCEQIIDMGGAGNAATGNAQIQNCGGGSGGGSSGGASAAWAKFRAFVSAHPTEAKMFVVILFVIIVALLFMGGGDDDSSDGYPGGPPGYAMQPEYVSYAQ